MDENLGRVTIAPTVLITIVHKTAASVPGVARMCDNVPGVKRLLGRHAAGRGVEVRILDNQVAVDIHLMAKRDVDLLQMGRRLQREINRSIQDIVGKSVREVNVHIEDIATELSEVVGSRAE